MGEHPLTKAAREHHEEQAAKALRAAIDGTHPFVVVDMDAPMRTCGPTAGGKTRMSPDVWRNLMRFVDPVAPIPYEARMPEPMGQRYVPIEELAPKRLAWWP